MSTAHLFRDSEDVVVLAAGDALFREGDAADVMYVVQSGRLEVRIGDRVIDTVGEGGVVGELALIDSEPRSADVLALEESRVVPVDRTRFTSMVAASPRFALTVMGILAERIRAANRAAG